MLAAALAGDAALPEDAFAWRDEAAFPRVPVRDDFGPDDRDDFALRERVGLVLLAALRGTVFEPVLPLLVIRFLLC